MWLFGWDFETPKDFVDEKVSGELADREDQASGVNYFLPSLPDRTFKDNTTWDGWEASLIKSKERKVEDVIIQHNYDICVIEEDIKMILLEEHTHKNCGKERASGISKTKRRIVDFDKFLKLLLSLRKIKEDKHSVKLRLGNEMLKNKYSRNKEEQVHKPFCGKSSQEARKIAETVALLTSRVMACVPFPILEAENIPQEICRSFKERVFCSAVKFILSVFDTEDFERIRTFPLIARQYKFFCDKLKNGRARAVEVAEGKIDLDVYYLLREHDVGDLLWQHQLLSDQKLREISPFDIYDYLIGELVGGEVSEPDITHVLTVMQDFVPLKEHCKMQLHLELSRWKCFYVLDTLLLEFWKDIRIDALFKVADEPSALGEVATMLNWMILNLGDAKCYMMRHFENVVTFPLSHHVFGPCTSEFVALFKIADHERRMRGHRFISLHHILFGLSLTRLGDHVNKLMVLTELLGVESSDLPVYSLYRKSVDVASCLGHDVMGLEHLLIAIVVAYGDDDASQEKKALFEDVYKWVKQSGTEPDYGMKSDIISWTDPNVWMFVPGENGGMFNHPCFYVMLCLYEALENGSFTLPKMRQSTIVELFGQGNDQG